jgi:hypothetical protein
MALVYFTPLWMDPQAPILLLHMRMVVDVNAGVQFLLQKFHVKGFEYRYPLPTFLRRSISQAKIGGYCIVVPEQFWHKLKYFLF